MPSNHRLLVAARPVGIPGPANFTADAVPTRPPGPREALLETIYLSIDPALRSWMSEGTGYTVLGAGPISPPPMPGAGRKPRRRRSRSF